MVKCARIPTFTLTGIEEKIQILQTVIGDNLPWLEHSFGKCERHETDEAGEIIVKPVVFVDNTTDPQDVRPNDNYKAYAFWDVLDPGRTEAPGEEGSVRKYIKWEYDVALIIWANLKRIEDSSYIETKAKFREDVMNVFETKLISQNVDFMPTENFDRDINQIFLGYTLDKSWNINKWPYIAFRFNGVVRFNRKCPVDNSYSRTTCT